VSACAVGGVLLPQPRWHQIGHLYRHYSPGWFFHLRCYLPLCSSV
jgi:hypothetical protein